MFYVLHKHKLRLVIYLIPLTEQVLWLQCIMKSVHTTLASIKVTKGPQRSLKRISNIPWHWHYWVFPKPLPAVWQCKSETHPRDSLQTRRFEKLCRWSQFWAC